MSLFHADSYSPDDMVMHPRHQAMQPVLVQLIQQLRACETVEAGADFQRALLTRLLEVEKDRWEFKRAVTRIRNGKQPHREAPELQSGRDPVDIATWRFEHDVCERLARQLRSVGDALAWRVFGFHRPFILALCRNQSPGPMYGKAGLPAELEHFERACKEDGAFALLHDLTNCLRIGDITVWDGVNPPRTQEIKTPQDPLPRAVRRPPAMTIVNRLPATEAGRQVPPGEAGPLPEQNSVDHTAVGLPASTPPAIRRQVRLESSPLFVRKISPPHVPRNECPAGASRDPSDTP